MAVRLSRREQCPVANAVSGRYSDRRLSIINTKPQVLCMSAVSTVISDFGAFDSRDDDFPSNTASKTGVAVAERTVATFASPATSTQCGLSDLTAEDPFARSEAQGIDSKRDTLHESVHPNETFVHFTVDLSDSRLILPRHASSSRSTHKPRQLPLARKSQATRRHSCR